MPLFMKYKSKKMTIILCCCIIEKIKGEINMVTSSTKNNFWIFLLCMLSGLTVGYFIGSLCTNVSFLKWLNYAGCFGFDQPIQLNLGVIWFSIQIKFNITISSIIGMILGLFLYKKAL